MSNRFYFGDDDNSSNASENDLDSLPYPKPLKRSDFLVPNFSPTEYLSTLQNRHQTLEDLRTDLRTRSQDLNKELLDLVNHNYQDFLGLGSSLKGGDEKVEEVRLGLLGFRREVEGLRSKIGDKKQDIEQLITARKAVREQIHFGRQLLELDQRIGELEQRLQINQKSDARSKAETKNGFDGEEESDSDSEDEIEEDYANIPAKRLRRRVEQYVLARKMIDSLGPEQPFVAKQESRVLKIRQTLLLDMGSALKSTFVSDGVDRGAELYMLETYRMMDESNEAVKVLKEPRPGKR